YRDRSWAALRHDAVLSTARENLDLLRLLLVQRPMEEGFPGGTAARAPRPRPDERVTVIRPPDLYVFEGAREAHLHLVGDVLVEGVGRLDDPVAASGEVGDEPRAIDREVFRRHPPRGAGDDLVRDLRLQLAGDLLPHRTLHAGQQLAILLPAVPGEAL